MRHPVDRDQSRAVVSLVVRTETGEMHTTSWRIPGCHAGRHIEEFRALMAAVGPPASETLRSREQAEHLARYAAHAGGAEL